MGPIEIGVLISMAGCFVGLAGWLAGRDKKIAGDSEWRGSVNSKLDALLGINNHVQQIDEKLDHYGERIAKTEASTASAHKRLDEYLRKHGGAT